LYYPYIHIRSEDWLKATLLYAPTVTRIVPNEYTPEDQGNITPYTMISGPYGKLLQPVSEADMDAAKRAQHKLTKRLEEHHDEIMKRYSKPNAPLQAEY